MIRVEWEYSRDGWPVTFAVRGADEAFIDLALAEAFIEVVCSDDDGELTVSPAHPDPLEPAEVAALLYRASDILAAEDRYALAVSAAKGVPPRERHALWISHTADERASWRTACDAHADAVGVDGEAQA